MPGRVGRLIERGAVEWSDDRIFLSRQQASISLCKP